MLARWADIALGDDPDRRAVLVIDQFEELFTQSSSEEERVAFLDLLTRAATVEGGRLSALITLRSDFISECAAYPHLNALLNLQFAQVGPMRPEELVSAIALPALQVGLRVDPDLIAQVVADMRDEPGALPLMQFALKDLFDAQQARGGVIALTLADYLARGGVRGSLARHADGILGSLPPPEQELARAVFSGLVQVKPGAQPARRTAALGELAPAGAADARAVIRKLADGRLISTDEQGGRDFVTLAHERLIESWPWLSRLIEENREAIAIRNQIGDDAAQWLARGRDPGYVYTGGRLDYARDQLAKVSPPLRAPLSAQAAEFLAASDQEEARRKRARYLGQAAGGAIGVAAGYGAFFALSVAFAYANAGQNTSLMARVSLVTFLALAPIGALVGLCVGLGLYRWRSPAGASRGAPPGALRDARRHVRRGLGTGAAGALAGAAAQMLAQLATGAAAGTGAVLIDPVETGIGALFGLGVGLGAGLFSERRWRLLFTPAFTLGAAALAELAALAASGGLTRHPAVTLAAGLLLGVCSASGFVVTGVEE